MPNSRYESSPDYSAFNDRLVANLRRVRENAGMTQEEFSNRSGLSIGTIRKLETCQQKVSAYVVNIYCVECEAKITDVMPQPRHAQANLAENAIIIDDINSDLHTLSTDSLELIRVLSQHLSRKSK